MWSTGINRNIVECKVRWIATARAEGEDVLIETLWNVKDGNDTDWIRSTVVLIETLWNVKWDSHRSTKNGRTSINRNIVECKAR